jgi:tetratricopeptide (TPR) repeat protein
VNELRRELEKLEGAAPPAKLDAEALTTRLFAFYDARRTATWDQTMAEAAAAAQKGAWAEVAARYDAILAQDPLYAKRGEMVAGYVELGKLHAAQAAWADAVKAFHKAWTLAAGGDAAAASGKEAEARLYWARAMLARAEGKSGDDDLARAVAADPTVDVVREAASSAQKDRVRSRRGWMLYAGVGSGAVALALLLFVFVRRK